MLVEILATAILAVPIVGGGVVALMRFREEEREEQRRRDEDAQTIAMGEGMGIEYIPGEDIDLYRTKVVVERDRRVRRAQKGRP